MDGVTTGTDRAVALEAEAEEFPDERGSLLLEALVAWRRAGHAERAYELAAELIAGGGSDGCFARCQRVEFLLEDGYRDRATEQLAELARHPALEDSHCQMIGELLAEIDDLDRAASWYDRAVARLSDARLNELQGARAGWSYASTIVRGRREVRERLGLEPDATDALVPELPAFDDLARSFGHPPPSREHILDDLRNGGHPRPIRLLVFRRDERAEAQRRWPDVYTGTDQEYFVATELGWRELRETGTSSITVVPVTVDGLVAFAEQIGGSPTDPAVKTRYSSSIADDVGVSWPPTRNAPCWCGSATKYKKCCGRPDISMPG